MKQNSIMKIKSFREKNDKQFNYLYSPHFFEKVFNFFHSNDFIFNFYQVIKKYCILKKIILQIKI